MNDIPPQSIKQLDNIILFKDHSQEKLQQLHEKTALSVPLKLFLEMYANATGDPENPYSFLWMDLPNQEFRKTFTDVYKGTKTVEERA